MEKRYRISIDYIGPLFRIESCVEYLDSLDLGQYFCDEINIIFLSNLKDITFFHFMEQPKSMLCRKLVRNIIDGSYDSYDYKWLPECFELNLWLYKLLLLVNMFMITLNWMKHVISYNIL